MKILIQEGFIEFYSITFFLVSMIFVTKEIIDHLTVFKNSQLGMSL